MTAESKRTAQQHVTESVDLGSLLLSRAADRAGRPAYVFLGTDLEATHVLSYEALGLAAGTIAQRLRECSRRGDRVLLAFNNGLEAVQLFWGCILAGVIPIPAPAPDTKNSEGHDSRLRGIVSNARVVLALTHESHLETGRTEVPEVPWCSLKGLLGDLNVIAQNLTQDAILGQPDIAYLQYTSGSTSHPRGVKITHENVLAQCGALMSALDTAEKRGLIWLPWFHDYGLVHGVIQPLYSGGTSFLMATAQFLLRPLRWLEAIEKHGVTHSGAPNFAYAACVRALGRTPGWSTRLDCWQLATCGAEPVRAATLDSFASAFAPYGFQSNALAPSYGLAEAVLAVTVRNTQRPLGLFTIDADAMEHHVVRPAVSDSCSVKTLVGCGSALPGFQLRIVDPDTAEPCAADRIGEVWVAGPCVAEGYWEQPEATAACFGSRLAAESADPGVFLRTGDLGFLKEGELFVSGRLKDLIVVNGRNLYPQDLERTAEVAHPNIRSGGAMAIVFDDGQKEMVILLVECSRRPSPETVSELVDAIQKQVAIEHQLDLHDIVPLRTGTLPRTSSGKPQRGSARSLYLRGELDPLRLPVRKSLPIHTTSVAAPDTLLIATLSQVWCEVLGRETIEPDANFFDLGGDSLLATQLVSRLRTSLSIDLPIRALFESPTVRGLACLVRQFADSGAEKTQTRADAIPEPHGARPVGTEVVLSYSQERMWFMHELAPESSAYNVPLAIRLHGPLSTTALEAAFARVIERHEVLRTRFVKSTVGVWGEVVSAPSSLIEEVRLVPEGETASDDALHHHLAEVCSVPFRLDQCPLFRAQLIHVAEQQAVLLIVMHHIVCDQWSFAELGRELATGYSAVQRGTEGALPDLYIQYADYAGWHRRWFEGNRRTQELAYWTNRLEGLDPLPLNEDFVRPRQPSFRGASLRLPMDPTEIAELRRFGAAHGASLAMVLIAALKVVLYRHTGKADIAIGVPIANRHHLASESLIGTFVNTLVFRTDLGGDPDFRTVLARVREVSLEAFAHQDMPFELLVRELAGRPGAKREPLFNVMFNKVNSQARDIQFHGLTWSRLDFDRASTQFDLTVVADMLYDHSLVFEYATDLFARETVQRMGEHMLRILRTVIQDPENPVATLPLLGVDEIDRLTGWSSGPTEPLVEGSVVTWVSNGLRRSGRQVALIAGSLRMTHKELDAASNRLARWLRKRGIARGSRVGLCLPRGQDLVIALLAVLKSGAAYVPLDPSYPIQRLHHQIDDAELALLITQQSVALARAHPPSLLLDVDHSGVAETSADPLEADPQSDARSEDPAYVIYTSGSTGEPKGVAVPHRAVVNLLTSMARKPGLSPQDRLLAVTTPSFDISVLELMLPLGVGGTVVMASEAQATDGRALAELIARESISVLQATPSRWHMLIDSGWIGSPQLKALVGGEPLTSSLAKQMLARCGEVWNMYGPTETTVWSSCWRVSTDKLQSIALGHPVANTSIQVLDDHRQLCPIGVPGEIHIGGAGVALGYYKRPELTAERFIHQCEVPKPLNLRLYRTGDRGRWRHDGSLEHLGRLDDQIKLRGFRVEIGEIEARLLSHPAVARAVVMLREDAPDQRRLVGYVVPEKSMPSRDQLRHHLRQWLPDHMVPGLFVELVSIPLLPNGKTNRLALPAPPGGSGSNAALEAPRNATETAILKIWKEVLQVEAFGIQDNFFDLGGHSILAVGVVSRIETELDRPCALRLLFEHPTVADLAAALDQTQPESTTEVPLVMLQPHGRGPGLFLLAGAERYRDLARRLDPRMPVYGVYSQTEIDLLRWPANAPLPIVSVKTLAQEYLSLVQSAQPRGPYFLGGFSIGGALAYEVAHLLQKQGEDIGLVVLLDTMLPGFGVKHIWAGVVRRLRLLRRDGLNHLVHLYRMYQEQRAVRQELGGRRIEVYAQAMRSYQAASGHLPVLFLQAGDDVSTEVAYGWKSIAAGLAVERVPGKHMDILHPPNVDVLASVLRTHIDAAKAAGCCMSLEASSTTQSQRDLLQSNLLRL